ncbi:unnamed protein product [Musa acuminata subsp. burmannicoides]
MDTESVDTQRVVAESGHDSHTWRKLTGDNFSSHASYADLRQRSVTDMGSVSRTDKKIVEGEFCYMYRNPLQDNPAYSVVKYHFVNEDDTVPQKIVVQKSSPGGIHFRRGGPRQRVYFRPEDVYACILTCGGLCPGLNTVIKDVVCGLSYMYGVKMIVGIQGGYKGFYARNTIPLTPKSVNDIHKRGGTILGTSRGGHDAIKIVDNIFSDVERKLIYWWFLFPPVYIIGGDGTQKGAAGIRRRGLKLAVAGTPKTTDNDIAVLLLLSHFFFIRVLDKSFGFDTTVEEAQRAINAAHVEAEKAWRMV